MGINCTQRTPIIELFLTRFREIKRFYSPLKSDIKSTLLSFTFLVVFKNQFFIFIKILNNQFSKSHRFLSLIFIFMF